MARGKPFRGEQIKNPDIKKTPHGGGGGARWFSLILPEKHSWEFCLGLFPQKKESPKGNVRARGATNFFVS